MATILVPGVSFQSLTKHGPVNILRDDREIFPTWIAPLTDALEQHAGLKRIHRRWHRLTLSDLAMSIEARLNDLQECAQLVDENCTILVKEISGDRTKALWSAAIGCSYPFKDRSAARRLVIAGTRILSEGRACLENLKTLHRELLGTIKGHPTSKSGKMAAESAAWSFVATVAPQRWASRNGLLRCGRNAITHEYAASLAFDTRRADRPAPLLWLNWRPGRLRPRKASRLQLGPRQATPYRVPQEIPFLDLQKVGDAMPGIIKRAGRGLAKEVMAIP